jgi:GT2 family glycosyltransferase
MAITGISSTKSHPVAEMPLVSIIITSCSVKNFSNIVKLLSVLNKQSYSNLEVIIIVDGDKNLFERLKTHNCGRDQNARVIFTDNMLGLSGARNLGARISRGEIIAFIDDDAIPSVDWVEKIIETFKLDPFIAAVTGPAFPLWEDKPIDWIPRELQWIIGTTVWYDEDKVCDVRHAWGMNMAFRRDIFLICNGFSIIHGLKRGEREGIDRFPHEDVEFCLRLKRKTGMRIVYNPNVKVFHKVSRRKLTVKFFAKHAYVQGFAKRMLKELIKKYGENAKDMLSREYELLEHVLFVTIPKIFKEIPRKPKSGLNKLFVTMIILFFLAIGYYSPFFSLKLKNYAD